MTRKPLQLAGFALLLSLGGCWDVPSNPAESGKPEPSEIAVAGQGGMSALDVDATNTSVLVAGGTTEAGTLVATGGAAETYVGAPAGGTSPGHESGTGGSSQTFVREAAGGTPPNASVEESRAQGGSLAVDASGGTASGGAQPAGGTTAAGGSAQAGAGNDTGLPESICIDASGAQVPYDYSFGLLGEYAFALSMDCNVGGYVMPLVLADPEQLSQVNAFIAEATDWYRTQILNCPDASSQLHADAYGLLPVSPSNDPSEADCDASLAVFLSVIDRHDTQPDAVNAATKDKIKNRIKSVKMRAVRNNTGGLTKTLTEPDCIPAESAGNGG